MKHTMLVQFQLLLRDGPPVEPVLGAVYYDTTMRLARIWDGEQWTSLGGEDEVIVAADEPVNPKGTDLWVDEDDEYINTTLFIGQQDLSRHYVDDKIAGLKSMIEELRAEIHTLKARPLR